MDITDCDIQFHRRSLSALSLRGFFCLKVKKEDNFGARIKIICNFVAERVSFFS